MKKILIILILLLTTSCSINNNEELNNRISLLEQEKKELINKIEETEKNNIFEKNKECGLLTDKIKEEINDPRLIYDTLDPGIEEIFYSKKRNSCLYIFSYFKSECENISPDNIGFDKYYGELGCGTKDKQLVDFFTKEYLASNDSYSNNQKFDCYESMKENNPDNYIEACNKTWDFNTIVNSLK